MAPEFQRIRDHETGPNAHVVTQKGGHHLGRRAMQTGKFDVAAGQQARSSAAKPPTYTPRCSPETLIAEAAPG